MKFVGILCPAMRGSRMIGCESSEKETREVSAIRKPVIGIIPLFDEKRTVSGWYRYKEELPGRRSS